MGNRPSIPLVFTMPPWWVMEWKWLLGMLLAALFLVGAALGSVVFAGMVTAPPATREATICSMLGTEAPCETEEIAHLRGTITLVGDDTPDGFRLSAGFVARSRTLAARLPDYGALDEAYFLDRVTNPLTNWSRLVAAPALWPALRELAGVTDGVPIIVAAALKKGGLDRQSDPDTASTALLRVRLAILRLR